MAYMHVWREQDGHLIHDATCDWKDAEVCTCGLLHHLTTYPENERARLFPSFNDQKCLHDWNIWTLLEYAG